MAARSDATPLIAIVGETASGKSALAMVVAERFDGEIICADSRTIYRGMDIGTAKPSAEDQARVPHHLLDVVAPDQPFTVFDFKQRAQAAIADIAKRGKLPLLVGGTGLYIDAVLYDFQFRPPADPRDRAKFAQSTVEELQQALRDAQISLPSNERNPRHLIRALETGGALPVRGELRSNTLIIGLQIDREQLEANVTARVDGMLNAGLVGEIDQLTGKFGSVTALQAPGYASFVQYLQGELSFEEARALTIQATRQLAKRQRTWFKRNKSIHWVSKQAEAVDLITTFLNK